VGISSCCWELGRKQGNDEQQWQQLWSPRNISTLNSLFTFCCKLTGVFAMNYIFFDDHLEPSLVLSTMWFCSLCKYYCAHFQLVGLPKQPPTALQQSQQRNIGEWNSTTRSNLSDLGSCTFILDANLVEINVYFTLSRFLHYLCVQVATHSTHRHTDRHKQYFNEVVSHVKH